MSKRCPEAVPPRSCAAPLCRDTAEFNDIVEGVEGSKGVRMRDVSRPVLLALRQQPRPRFSCI